MKKTAYLLLALIMIAALSCACVTPENNDPAATKAPEQSGVSEATQAPVSTPIPENTSVKIADFSYETFFSAGWIASEIEMEGSPIGVANGGVHGWTVADGKLYYQCGSDGMLHCRDIASGEDTALFNAVGAELSIDITYYNDMLYSLCSYTHGGEMREKISAVKLDGTAVGTIEIPKELYSIEVDPNRPEDPYAGVMYLVKYAGELMLAVNVYYEEFNYYTFDIQSGTITPREAPYTISRDDNNYNVVTYEDGSSVTLFSNEQGHIDCIGENGDIYCTYIYEPENREYRRYSSKGELLSVSRYGEEYTPYGETLVRYIEGEVGCLYFMDCSDESIMLIKMSLD